MLADVFAIFVAKVILVLIISIEPVVIRGYRCSWLCNNVAEYKTDEGAHADDHKLRDLCCGKYEIKLNSIGVDD